MPLTDELINSLETESSYNQKSTDTNDLINSLDSDDLIKSLETNADEDSWIKTIGKTVLKGAAATSTGISEALSLPGRALKAAGIPGFQNETPGGVWDYLRKSGEQTQKELTPNVPAGSAKDYVGQATTALAQMGTSAIAGPARILPVMSSIAGISKGSEMLDEGAPFYKALIGGIESAGMEYATEQPAFKVLMKPGGKFLAKLAKGLVTDIPGELIATANEMKMIDENLSGKSYSTEDYKKALWDTAIVSGLMTGMATAAVHPITSGYLRPANKVNVQQEADKYNQSDIKQSDQIAVEGPVGIPSYVKQEPTQAAINRVQGIGAKSPVELMTDIEAAQQIAKQNRLRDIKDITFKEDFPDTRSAEDAAATFESIEGKLAEIEGLVKDIKGVGKSIDYEVGSRAGLQVPVREAGPSQTLVDADATEIFSKLDELAKLQKVAEAVTGMNLRSVYQPAIDDVLKGLPDSVRLEVEKKQTQQIVQPVGIRPEKKGPDEGGDLDIIGVTPVTPITPVDSTDVSNVQNLNTPTIERRKGGRIREQVEKGGGPKNLTTNVREELGFGPEAITRKIRKVQRLYDEGKITQIEAQSKMADLSRFADKDIILRSKSRVAGDKKPSLIEAIKNKEEIKKIESQVSPAKAERSTKSESAQKKLDALWAKAEARRVAKVEAERLQKENDLNLRTAQKRELEEAIELGITEPKGPTAQELKELGRENLSEEDAELVDDAGFLDDTSEGLVEEVVGKKKDAKSILDAKDQDSMIRKYLKDRHGAKVGKAIFEKLDKDGKANIIKNIYADPNLYNESGGRTTEGSTRNELWNDEGGYLDLDFLDKGIRKIKEAVTLDVLPKTSRMSIEVANKEVEHASAKVAVQRMVKSMIANALPSKYKNADLVNKYKNLLNKDNILDGYDEFLRRAKQFELAGNKKEAIKWFTAAKKITEKHNLQEYDATIKNALQDPEIVKDMLAIKNEVNRIMDSLYAEYKGMPAETNFDDRGKYFGVRTNLVTKETAERWTQQEATDDTASNQDLGMSSSNYRNPNVKYDPFAMAAKFTGDYSTDMEASLTSVLMRRYNEITKMRIYNQLVKDGVGVIKSPRDNAPTTLNFKDSDGVSVTLKADEITRHPIKVPETDKFGTTTMHERVLYIPKEIVRELRDVESTDMRAPNIGLFTFLNKVQLAQATDAVFHTRNLVTEFARAQGAGDVWTDVVRKVPGIQLGTAIADIARIHNEIKSDTPEIRREVAEMAKQGLIREDYAHTKTPKALRAFINKSVDSTEIQVLKDIANFIGEVDLGQAIYKIDTAVRVGMNRKFNVLVERGLKKDTPEARREFISQVGQYNRRLMGPLMRLARDTGLAPFIVAGRNFNRQGIRAFTGASGGNATNAKAEFMMRFVNLTGTALLFTVPMLINAITVGDPNGRSGTKLGEIDLGLAVDENGRHKTLDLMQLSGTRRGMRITGLNAVSEGTLEQWKVGRESDSLNSITGQAGADFALGITHPWSGPAAQFVGIHPLTGMFGSHVTNYSPTHIHEGGGKQIGENIRASIEALNPTLYSLVRPTLVDIGIDQKPLEEGNDNPFEGALAATLKSPSGALGLKNRGSAAYQEMSKKFSYREGIPKQSPERMAIKALRNSLYGKTDDEIYQVLTNAKESKIVTEEQAEKLWEDREVSPLQRGFKALGASPKSIDEVVDVWKKATPEEKEQLAEIAQTKIENAWQEATPEEEDAFYELTKEVAKEVNEIMNQRIVE